MKHNDRSLTIIGPQKAVHLKFQQTQKSAETENKMNRLNLTNQDTAQLFLTNHNQRRYFHSHTLLQMKPWIWRAFPA